MDLTGLDINGLIFLIIGTVAVAGAFLKKDGDTLKNGVKAEGVVFKNDSGASVSISNKTSNRTFIWIRFVTATGEWITEELGFDNVSFTYTGQFKEGKKVSVIYNPENPKEFLIVQNISQDIVKWVLILVGIIFSGMGLFSIFA